MAEIAKGLTAVAILEREDVIKEFTDANNPIPIQVLGPLGFILNNDDNFAIRKENQDEGPTAAGAMLRKCLIQRFTDQPEKFNLKQFIDALVNLNTNVKLTEILNLACLSIATDQRPKVSQCVTEMTKDIRARLQYMCENVRRAWGKLLTETSLEKCFVEPEIVEEEMGEDGKCRKKETGKTVDNYKQLFLSDSLGDRIVIEGDPGMGKTTYVNKLALDWTLDERSEHYSENSQFLQSIFTIVFLIPLRTLNGRKATTFAKAASVQLKNCGSWLTDQFQTIPTECLLILDAFDEYDWSCPEINEIIDGKHFPRLKVIVTTRPSHIERLDIRNQWLSITGLTTPEKRERFLIYQGWKILEEREMIIQILSELGTLWHTPLYLAMLCVLYRVKKVTGFEPRHPKCFYILVKLFTDHIMSRCVNEKGVILKKEQRAQLKSFLQKRAIEEFSESNPWITETLNSTDATANSPDLMKLAGQFGLVTIREELSPVTGEEEETISFIHQMFLEYYAAVEFGPVFADCPYHDQCAIMESIEKSIGFHASPFSYFLSAESTSYKEYLLRAQEYQCSNQHSFVTIHIDKFPWLPEVVIYEGIFDCIREDILQHLCLYCDLKSVRNFWDADHMKELCSLAKPKKLRIVKAILGYHDEALDSILSSVEELKLEDCDCDHINLGSDKHYPNVTKFICENYSLFRTHAIDVMQHFINLVTLSLFHLELTEQSMELLCYSLYHMGQLEVLWIKECFTTSQSVHNIIKLGETIERSALCKSLKEVDLRENVLDTETECTSDVLLDALSKCAQLEGLWLTKCHMKAESFTLLKELFQNSCCKDTLQYLFLPQIQTIPPNVVDLSEWKKELSTILPNCNVHIS